MVELDERDRRQHALLTDEIATLRSRIATVDCLEQENRSLKAELLDFRGKHQKGVLGFDGNSRAPLGEISPNKAASSRKRQENSGFEHAKSGPTVAILENDYAKLKAKYAAARKTIDDLTALARKFRDERDGWLKYAEALEAKVKKLEKKNGDSSKPKPQLRITDVSGSVRPDEGLVVAEDPPQMAAPDPLAKPHTNSSFLSEPGASVSFSGRDRLSSGPPLSPRRALSTPVDIPLIGTPISAGRHSSSTEGESTYVTQDTVLLPHLPRNASLSGDVVIKDEPSSDGPIIVSERSVRKRMRDDPASEAPTARRVKSEHTSSDPVFMRESRGFSPQESIDLDNGQDPMTTPKKRRAQGGDDSAPADGSDEDDIDGITLVEACHPGPGELSSLQTHFRTPVEPQRAPLTAVRLSALIPSTYRPIISRQDTIRKPAMSYSLRLNNGVDELAESDDTPFCQNEQRNSIEFPNQAVASTGRLDTLLNKPSVEGVAVRLRPSRQIRKTPYADPFDIIVPTRELPFGKGDRRNASRTPKATANMDRNQENPKSVSRLCMSETSASKPPGVLKPSGAPPLRLQPLASLRLDDFKINPKFNDGQNYAFSEVVRNKSDRAELPGCTDPQCCGKHFRAMAQAELEAVGPSLVHRAADITLLEDYLGEQAYRLGLMNRLEKEELWLEAKTRELANKHGKHRHRFSRRQSPPGFWNTDFPSTQEIQKEREEGDKRERRLVEERWREAMRSGGRWLFRDER